ncbi:MAG: hypothetical protein RLZZ370_491 [Bacteroidota bacterium]|jgi:hypothetical protein
MKHFWSIAPLFLLDALHAQTDTARMQSAGLDALICADGSWGKQNQAGLRVVHHATAMPLIQKLGYWLTAKDGSGTMVGSVQDVFSDSTDFQPGPLGLRGSLPANTADWNEVFTADAATIGSHRQTFRTPGYQVPRALMRWPANGKQGFDPVLAPYVDFDQNGTYNPDAGDYPYFTGNTCAYTLSNDQKHVKPGTGKAPGIEVQQLVRAFEGDGLQDAGLIMRFTIHNRSLVSYYGMRFSLVADFAVGSNGDDFLLTDVGNHALVAYNGAAQDPLFGSGIPACALMLLNKQAGASMYFEAGADAVKGQPVLISDYYNLARARWKTGKPLAYGNAGLDGLLPAGFVYSNGTDPQFASTWNEWEAANFPGRRTGLISTDDFDLPAGASMLVEVSVAALNGIGNDPKQVSAQLQKYRQNASRLLANQSGKPQVQSPLFLQKGTMLELRPPRPNAAMQLDFYRLNGVKLGSYCILNASSFNLKNLPEEGLMLLVATSENQSSRGIITKVQN